MLEPGLCANRLRQRSAEESGAWRHVLRAGLLPVVTMMGLQFAFMMGGAIVVENIFSWNGLGRTAVAIFNETIRSFKASY